MMASYGAWVPPMEISGALTDINAPPVSICGAPIQCRRTLLRTQMVLALVSSKKFVCYCDNMFNFIILMLADGLGFGLLAYRNCFNYYLPDPIKTSMGFRFILTHIQGEMCNKYQFE